MLKTFKKLFFALFIFATVMITFACGGECPEPEECPAPTQDECDAKYPHVCPEPEECPEPQECPAGLIAPTEIVFDDDQIDIGNPTEAYLDTILPVGAVEKFYFTSQNPEILTIDSDGIMTGHRPGVAIITAVSVLDETVSCEFQVTVLETEADLEIVRRERDAFLAALPVYASASFEFPELWNPSVARSVKDANGDLLEKFEIPTTVATDYKVTLAYVFEFNGAEVSGTVTVWAVKNKVDNAVTRVNQAVAAVDAMLNLYTLNNEKVSGDVLLPTNIWGVGIVWTTSNASVLTTTGVYKLPEDDKNVKLSAVFSYGENGVSKAYDVVAKGYTPAEKVDYIVNKGALASINGKSFNTSIVLPTQDDFFFTQLSYVSSNKEIFTDAGVLVAAPTVATDVKFTVTIKYNVSLAAHNFENTYEMTVKAIPANEASAAAEAWLKDSPYKTVSQYYWSKTAGNIIPDLPKKVGDFDVTYDVSKKLYARGQAAAVAGDADTSNDKNVEVNVFDLVDGQPKLIAQYLRYTQAEIKATFKKDDVSASVNLVLNIGIQKSVTEVLFGTWRATGQKDEVLTEQQGRYDFTGNVSYFDRNISNVVDTFGSGYWSGYSFSTVHDGKTYRTFVMEHMTAYIREDADGKIYLDVANLRDGTGGNWGVFLVNTTNKVVKVEVGTYGASDQFYGKLKDEEGNPITNQLIPSSGLRESTTIDGYSYGFVADKDGNIVEGKGTGRFQMQMTKNLVTVGSEAAANLVGGTKAGEVHYVDVPAGGYAMSWKYQFTFSTTPVQNVYCNKDTVTIERFDVHPLSSQYATTANTNLVSAESKLTALENVTEDSAKVAGNVALETNIKNARANYAKLSGETATAVFALDRLVNAETEYANLLDLEIVLLLADVAAEKEGYALAVGNLNVRIKALSKEISDKLTKKVDFDAKFKELSEKILTITLDYQGGYANALYTYKDKDLILAEFKNDLYDFMVETNAFAQTPTRETFLTLKYWSDNYSKYAETELSKILFTAYSENNSNYLNVIEGSNRFINQAKYNKWVNLLDYVDEATRYAHFAGQDLWGKNGVKQSAMKWLSSLPNYSAGNAKALETITGTNSGTTLGAFRLAQYVTESLSPAIYNDYCPHNVYGNVMDRQVTQERFSKVTYNCTQATVELPVGVVKEGYTFDGWYLESDYKTPAVITGATNKDITVYAKWKAIPDVEQAPDIPWFTAKFYNGDTFINEYYVEVGSQLKVPTVKKSYYTFNGWSTDKDATSGNKSAEIDVPADVTYYATWRENDKYAALTVDPNADYSDPTILPTIVEALEFAADNAVITVLAGSYEDDINIISPVKILGPNDNKLSSEERVDEAVILGAVKIKGGLTGVALKGFKFTKLVSVDGSCTDLEFASNLIIPTIVNSFLISGDALRLNFHDNINEYANNATAIGYAQRSWRINGVLENSKFNNNKVISIDGGSTYSAIAEIIYITTAKGTLEISGNEFYHNQGFGNYLNIANGSALTELKIENNKFATGNRVSLKGLNIASLGDATKVIIKNNEFKDLGGVALYIGGAKDALKADLIFENNKFVYSTTTTKYSLSLFVTNITESGNTFTGEVTFADGGKVITIPAP